MKQFILFTVLFFIISGVSAQQTMSLKDATLGSSSYLKPAMPEQLKWKDAKHYVMIKASNLFSIILRIKIRQSCFRL